MQAQAQGVGQQGQGSQVMSDGFNLFRNSSTLCWKPWHRDDDASLRQEVFAQIPQLLRKRGLEKNLLEIAKDVETALYLDAVSKEEYGDLQTLDFRLYSLMLRLKSSQKHIYQGIQHGSFSTSACSNGFSNPEVTAGATWGTGKSSSSLFFNVGSSGEECASVGQDGFAGSTAAVNDQNGGLNTSNTTAETYQRNQYMHGGISFPRSGLLGKEVVLHCGGLPNLVQAAGEEVGISSGSYACSRALSLEKSFNLSDYLHHGRPQLSDGVSGDTCLLEGPSDSHEGSGFHVSMLPTRFGIGNSSFLASEPFIPVSEQKKQLDGNNMFAADEHYLEESESSAIGLHVTPSDQPSKEFSSQLQPPHAIGSQNSLHQGENFPGNNQWQLQKSLQSNVGLNVQPNHSEQTCQASSAEAGHSEVFSSDDGLMPKKTKNAENLSSALYIKRQQWLLIFLRHVSRCLDSGKCSVAHCAVGRESWKHLTACQLFFCNYPRCSSLKWLLGHHQKCRNVKCVVCGPVRQYLSQQATALRTNLRREFNLESDNLKKEVACIEVDSLPMKRAKLEIVQSDVLNEPELPLGIENKSCHDKLPAAPNRWPINSFSVRADIEQQSHPGTETQVESPTESLMSVSLPSQENAKQVSSNSPNLSSPTSASGVVSRQVDSVTLENQELVNTSAIVSDAMVKEGSSNIVKSGKSKISGISFIESFSPEEIRQHITSLRKWIGQSKCKVEKNQALERKMSASACSACGVENLYFDPIPIFCTQCGCRIKRNYVYHSTGSGENSFNFCGPCYGAFRDDVLESDGFKVQKSMLVKKRNDEQRVEGWVECDKCKKWQHQICVLFNARINKERSEYACPDCCISEMEQSARSPLLANRVPGAEDLPKTILSDVLEERLALKLYEERMERSRALRTKFEEVPTAEGLVVRVISSVDKKLDVKPRFLELFQEEDYPKDFLYKSKMVMLFQKIEGVEVCLFGMYVQEFGSDCPQPNQRWVYLSYLDSVKYFRPDVKTMNGEALRTYVYHEILIGYLDYCKKRGFSNCYIWACPPLKGDDYILYCHPEIQKTPKTDKLREWYVNMITKAKKEKIVVANKNLYDYFFTMGNGCKAKVSAAHLPYFDGDYWPGAAEDILQQFEQEKEGYYSQRKGRKNKIIAKRTTKTSAHTDLAGSQSKDLQLMSKLGQSIAAMKEDFIIVQMHHTCSQCHLYIVSGCSWVCQRCSGNFELCVSCYEEHENLEEEDRHPAGKRELHQLLLVEQVCDIPADTKDEDDIMESEFFDNRHSFLSLCQGNQYQYDTLRRAKHSSMMVLYHLHNPNAPAFITSCAICHNELETGHGWKCKSCTDFDVCSACYSSTEVQRHPHKFIARITTADLTAANSDLRKQRMLQLRIMLEVLVHASKCCDPSCQYGKCRNMKELFRHGNSCTRRAMGGCSICKRMWFLLTTHARSCREAVCSVPRCMDIRKHLKRAQLQQDSRRRAAVNEMIRQRAAEAAGVR